MLEWVSLSVEKYPESIIFCLEGGQNRKIFALLCFDLSLLKGVIFSWVITLVIKVGHWERVPNVCQGFIVKSGY